MLGFLREISDLEMMECRLLIGIRKTDNTSWFYSYPVIFEMSISAQSKIIYIYFCRQADENGKCFPSVKQIAKACGIGQTRIRKSLVELENAGLIERQVQFRPNQNGQTSNLYTVIEYIAN